MGYYNPHNLLGQLLWPGAADHPSLQANAQSHRPSGENLPPGQDECMPELPEVEVTLLRITPHIQGNNSFDVTVRNPRIAPSVSSEIRTEIPGLIIQDVERHGKELIFHFATGWIYSILV
jgi:hypothetical protein